MLQLTKHINKFLSFFVQFLFRIFLLICIVVFLEGIFLPGNIPKRKPLLETSLEYADVAKLAVRFVVLEAKVSFCILKSKCIVGGVLVKKGREVVHELGAGEVGATFVSQQMQVWVDQLLHDSDVRVVEVVSHWHHCSRRETPPKTPSADLRVQTLPQLFVESFVAEHAGRVLTQSTEQTGPLFIQLVSVFGGVPNHAEVLRTNYNVLGPVAKEIHLRHQIQIRLPKRIFPFLYFIHQK